MARFTVEQGRRYRAKVNLSWGESLVAGAGTIQSRLEGVGFVDVSVSGSGKHFVAEATWLGDTTTVDDLPDEVDLDSIEVIG